VLRRHLPFLLLWSALWALFFAGLLLGQTRLPNSDLSGQFHAFARFQAAEMWAGRLPLWSPGSFGGFPFAADSQAAVFYPPRWLTILLDGADLSFYAITLEGLLHIWLAGLFTYALAYDQTGSRRAGLLAAIAFGLGGYLISYPLLQLALLETITWLPLILWLLRRGVRAERPLRPLLGAGLVWGLSFTAGHPQTFLHLSYLTIAYYLFLTIRARWAWRWIVGLGALLGGTAVGLSATAWLPAAHYLSYTTRSDVSYEFVSAGFPLIDYLQLLTPGVFSYWIPMYGGLAVTLLALFAWMGRGGAEAARRAEIGFWTAVALLTLVLSLGNKGALFELAYHVAPGFSLFRQQERLVGLFSLSLALLAAQGFTLWLRESFTNKEAGISGLGFRISDLGRITLTLFVLTAVTLAGIRPEGWTAVLLRQGAILAVVLLILWRGSGRTWGAWALIFLLFFDLSLAVRPTLYTQPESPAVFWPQPDWLPLVQGEEAGRLDSSGLVHVNLGELYGLEEIRGLSPLKLRWINRLEAVPNARRWQLLNVTHVLAANPPNDAAVREVTAVSDSILPGEPFSAALYRFADALPRAWLVYEPIFAADEEAAFQLAAGPEFDPATQVVLTEVADVTGWTAVTPPTQPPQVQTTRTAANTLTITATTDTPGILVISEWDYPGWRVQTDGAPVIRARANGGFQAILLPPGDHTITLRFAPTDVTIGVIISLATLFLVMLLGWRGKLSIVNGQWSMVNVRPSVDYWPLTIDHWQLKPALLLIILLGFALRVFRLGWQELRGDEAFNYLFARMATAEIIPTLIGEGDPHSPFPYLLLHGWLRLTGDSEFAMRYLSLVAGVLLLPLIYALGAALGSRRIGLLAMLLAAVSQSLIWLAQDMRSQYSLVLLFSVLATLLLVKLADSRLSAGWWLAYAVVAATAVYSHYHALFILLAQALYLWWLPKPGRGRRLVAWVRSGLLAALLFAPWLLAMWRGLLASGQLGHRDGPELAAYLVEMGIELMAGPSFGGGAARWLFIGTLLLALLGGRWLARQRPAWAALLIGWVGISTLFIYLIRFNRDIFNNYYISIAAPAWWLLVAAGLLLLWGQRGRGWRALALAGLGLILLSNAISLTRYYFDPAYGRSVGYRAVAERVLAQAKPGDIFLAHFPDPSLRYYLRHATTPIVMLPETAEATAAETEAALADLSQAYERIWFVPYANPHWDRGNVVGRWLDYHLLHESRNAAQRLTLWAYRPPHSAPAVMTPYDTRFGEHIRLAGVYLTANGEPVVDIMEVRGETAVTVTLLWEALDAVPENYTAFVHALNESGMLVAQHDGVPLFATRPTTTWQPGEQLLDRHELRLPAGGIGENGRFIIGLYHSDTMERLGVVDIGEWRKE
jgi:4-amino-4-deoxy-L-arabinose transferase-like glycosyltransferase